MSKHPIQPLELDKHGVMRFRKNKLVDFIASNCKYDLNQLVMMGDTFSKEDWTQFSQLTGYSLSGWGGLSYVDNDTYGAAVKMSEGMDEKDARIKDLTETLNEVRKAFKELAPHLFNIHEDDLEFSI